MSDSNIVQNAEEVSELNTQGTDQQVSEDVSAEEAIRLASQSKESGKSIQDLLKEAQGKAPSSVKPKSEVTKEEARELIRKHKVKVDGKELEVDEEELKRGYSHQKAASKKMQEGVQLRKEAEQFINMMKDPAQFYEVAKKLGHDPRSLAEKYLVEQLEEENLDPKDKELRDARKKLKAIEEMETKQREKIEAGRIEEMKQKYVKDYETQFIDALKTTQLPPTKAMVGEMAKYISRSAKIGFKMSPNEAAQLVKEDVQKAQMNLIGNADGETLLRLLGDDVAKKILTARGSMVKQSSKSDQPIVQGQKRDLSQPNKRMSPKEWAAFKRRK